MFRLQGKLHNDEVDSYIQQVDSQLEAAGVLQDERLRIRLSLEEILLEYARVLGKDSDVKITVRKKFGRVRVSLDVPGEMTDPVNDTDSLVLIKTLHRWSGAPDWRYKDGVNRISFTVLTFSTTSDNLKFAWKYARKNKGYLILGVIMQLISVGLMILAPLLSARIITGITENAFSQLFYTGIALLATNLFSAVALAVCNWAYNVLYNRTLTALETELSEDVLKITNESLDEHGTGLFIQRMTTDTSSLATAFGTFADNLSQVCQYAGILVAMLFVNPLVFLAGFILLVLQILVETKRQREVKKQDRIFRNQNERYTGIIGEMVRGAKDIKLIHAEGSFRERMTERIRSANDSRMYRDSQGRKYGLIGSFVRESGLFLFILLLGTFLQKNFLSVASALVLFNYYSLLDSSATKLLSQIMDFVTDFNLSCERLHELMSPVFPKESFGTVSKKDIRGEVRFENVSFSYNIRKLGVSTRFVLSRMSFEIRPGEIVAFVGRSGCGKTTVINLISKLYEAFSGRVLIDGTDIRDLDQDSLRGCMTVVTQSPYLFQMSVRDNFRIVKPDMTDEEMVAAAKQACIAEDIERMPDGYDTILGEGGVNLSGGQKQRLAIARSLLKDSRILILDEATSALDNVTQDEIRRVIQNLRGKCTVIMIAHRFSTIVDADTIYYVGDGKILAQGTHRELMQQSEDYRSLYTMEAGFR